MRQTKREYLITRIHHLQKFLSEFETRKQKAIKNLRKYESELEHLDRIEEEEDSHDWDHNNRTILRD